jgi:hypothetical protein
MIGSMKREELIAVAMSVFNTDLPDEPEWSRLVIAKHVADAIINNWALD